MTAMLCQQPFRLPHTHNHWWDLNRQPFSIHTTRPTSWATVVMKTTFSIFSRMITKLNIISVGQIIFCCLLILQFSLVSGKCCKKRKKKEGGRALLATKICWQACFQCVWISRSSPSLLWSFQLQDWKALWTEANSAVVLLISSICAPAGQEM